MKSIRIFSVVVASLATALCAMPAFSQTASLRVGGVPTATCSYSDLSIGSTTTGNIDINCTTSVNYTGNTTPPPAGTYALALTASPVAGGTFACSNLGAACAASYAAGTTVPVTATAATGYTFSTWNGGPCNGTNTSPCNVTLNANVSMTAVFTSTTTTPPPNGVVMGTALPPICGTANASQFTGIAGTTYAWPLTKTSTGSGSIQATASAGANNSFQIEMSISKVPGDWSTAQAATVTASGGFGGTTKIYYPYYGIFGAESAGMTWVAANDNRGTAIVPTTEQWYFNLRFVGSGSTVTLQLSSPTCN